MENTSLLVCPKIFKMHYITRYVRFDFLRYIVFYTMSIYVVKKCICKYKNVL